MNNVTAPCAQLLTRTILPFPTLTPACPRPPHSVMVMARRNNYAEEVCSLHSAPLRPGAARAIREVTTVMDLIILLMDSPLACILYSLTGNEVFFLQKAFRHEIKYSSEWYSILQHSH